jgi:hypothetical protein
MRSYWECEHAAAAPAYSCRMVRHGL